MARTSVTTQTSVDYKLTPTMTAPIIDGDVVDVGDVRLLVVASSAPVTVTVVTPKVVDGLDVEDLQVTVPVDTVPTLIGPLPKRLFGRADGDTDAGRAYVDYDTVTGVTRAVIAV